MSSHPFDDRVPAGMANDGAEQQQTQRGLCSKQSAGHSQTLVHDAVPTNSTSCTPMHRSSNASISEVQDFIENEVRRLRPGKREVEQHLQGALGAAQHGSFLHNCRLEVTGSVSWDGDVPQSDLDIMLCTPEGNSDSCKALSILRELWRSLEERADGKCIIDWGRVELLSTARVPILRIHFVGCYCDVAVDQLRAIDHRDFLRKTLKGRPQVKSLLRLVKFWLRQRGLPLGSEGGLPSLAWVFAALSLADEQPEGTSLEVLLMYFFSEMHKLGKKFLDVQSHSSKGLEAVHQDGWISNWTDEWIELFRVADPSTRLGAKSADNSSCMSSSPDRITPPSTPTALGLLYVAELRLAWHAIGAKEWYKIWQAPPPAVKMQLPSIFLDGECEDAESLLHVVLQDGVVSVGKVQQARPCPGLPTSEVLHRRDQSSQLQLQPFAFGMVESTCLAEKVLTFQPCHWICTLPSQELSTLQGIGLSRVLEVAQTVGITCLSPGLQRIINILKPSVSGCMPMPMMSMMPMPMMCMQMPTNRPVCFVNPWPGQSQYGQVAFAGNSQISKTTAKWILGEPVPTMKAKSKKGRSGRSKHLLDCQNYSQITLDKCRKGKESQNYSQASADRVECQSDMSTRASDTEDLQPGKEGAQSRQSPSFDDWIKLRNCTPK